MNAQTKALIGAPVSDLHAAALAYAARGWPVFPCVPNGKVPPEGSRGYQDATTDSDIIDAWWNENPDFNIGLCPNDVGLAVLDEDSAKGGDVTPLQLPATYTVETPSGGKHYYFVGTVPPTVGKLGPHIDTRGQKSYVLVPPSRVDGRPYHVVSDREPVALPTEIEAKATARAEVGVSSVHDLDLPGNVTTARHKIADLLARKDVAVEGHGGDDRTYKLACELVRDLGLSVDTAMAVIEPWNAACVPPWETDELRAKLEHAAEYGQNEPGTYATRPASETFKLPQEALPNSPDAEPRKRVSFAPVDLLALAESEPPTYWDDGGLLVRAAEGAVTVLYGRKGINKTGFMLSATVSLVLRNQDARVAYFAGEAPDDLARSRIPPVCEHFGASLPDLVRTKRFALIDRVPQLLDADQVTDALAALGALRPNIVVIDTATRALFGANLNSIEVMTAAYAAAERIRQTFKALVVIIHHEGKDESKGAKGDSSLEQNADIVLHATSPAKGTTRIHLKHSRYGRDGGEVFFRSRFYSKPGRYKDVPVLQPISASEVENVPAFEQTADDKFRSRICEVLRENGAHDPYKTGMRTMDLAKGLVQPRWQHVARPTEEQERQYNTEVAKMVERLDNGAKMRRDKRGQAVNGKLTTLCERVIPPGAGERGKPIRMWYVPPPLPNDPA